MRLPRSLLKGANGIPALVSPQRAQVTSAI
jgi:hypothetical protein